MRRTKAFFIGAGAAFFLDPSHGRRRRRVLRDRGSRLARRARRRMAGKARYELGHARGLAARLKGTLSSHGVALDDRTVEQRVRSDALRDVGVSVKEVEVGVENGVVVLQGTVGRASLAESLIARVRKVPGVVDVAAMLRVSPEHPGGRAG